MTCIVGLIHKNKIYMGADSAGANTNFNLTIRKDKKIFKKESFIIGFCGSFRIGQLLQYSLNIPLRHPSKDAMGYMVTDVIWSIRQLFRDNGSLRLKDNVESIDAAFIIGYDNRLFMVQEDLQIHESLDDFDATGCAHDIAKGHLYATKDHKDPEYRIIESLKAAEHFSAGVRSPFTVISS